MRRLLTTTTALLALAAPLVTSAPAVAAPADVEIKPGTLSRGPDVAGAHLDGKTIHDGDVTVKLTAPRVLLYGKWNDFYIVATGDREWGNVKLVRVAADGATKRLAKFIDPFNTQLDSDGGQVAYSYGDSTSKPTIAVYDLDQNAEVTVNAFGSLPQLLDFDEGLVVASFWDFKVKTILWDTTADTTERVNSKQANYASVAHDLVGFFNKDPFNGGCQVLAQLSDPTDVLWTNCDERIDAVSPRRQAGGHDRAPQRRHRPGRRDGAQDRRCARRPLLDQRLVRSHLVGDPDQAADGVQRSQQGGPRALQGRAVRPGLGPDADARPVAGVPSRQTVEAFSPGAEKSPRMRP